MKWFIATPVVCGLGIPRQIRWVGTVLRRLYIVGENLGRRSEALPGSISVVSLPARHETSLRSLGQQCLGGCERCPRIEYRSIGCLVFPLCPRRRASRFEIALKLRLSQRLSRSTRRAFPVRRACPKRSRPHSPGAKLHRDCVGYLDHPRCPPLCRRYHRVCSWYQRGRECWRPCRSRVLRRRGGSARPWKDHGRTRGQLSGQYPRVSPRR